MRILTNCSLRKIFPHLSNEQLAALSPGKNSVIAAGAGTGKTMLLSARYVLALLEADTTNSLNGPENVAAITFTRKAAAELRERIYNEIHRVYTTLRNTHARAHLQHALDEFHKARISTIHAFCSSLLRENCLAAGVEPGFTVMDEYESEQMARDAISETISVWAGGRSERSPSLLRILDNWSLFSLKELLMELIRKRHALSALRKTATLPHAGRIAEKIRDSMEKSKRLKSLEDISPENDMAAAELMAVLLDLATDCIETYQRKKASRGYLDSDDLLLYTHRLLNAGEKDPQVVFASVSRTSASRIKHILVDEFQDTDDIQWEIIRAISLQQDGIMKGLFIVGDEKQSIFSFRGGDVTVFKRAINELSCPKNRRHTTFRQLTENYRSLSAPLSFTNNFFQELFSGSSLERSPYDARPQILRCVREAEAKTKGKVIPASSTTFIITPPKEEVAKTLKDLRLPGDIESAEAACVAKFLMDIRSKESICSSVADRIRSGEPAVAILFRRRKELNIFQQVFQQLGIDHSVYQGTGFFQAPEVMTLINMLDFLRDERQDIALVGALRSGLFCFSDDEIFEISLLDGETFYRKMRNAAKTTEKERALSDRDELRTCLKAETMIKICEAISLIERWKKLLCRLRISELIRAIVNDSAFYLSFAGQTDWKQKIANVRKFITMARSFESGRVRDLEDFVESAKERTEEETKEGLAQLEPESLNPVQLMTIHAAKGLQFPMVIIADTTPHSISNRRPAIISFPESMLWPEAGDEKLYLMGIDIISPTPPFKKIKTTHRVFCNYLSDIKEEAEEKRLLYVACTRAMDHLVISLKQDDLLNENKRKDKKGYITWISQQVEGIKEAVLQRENNILFNSQKIQLVYPDPAGLKQTKSPPLEVILAKLETGIDHREPRLSLHSGPLKHEHKPRLTPTDLCTYLACQRKFYYKRLLGLPEFAAQAAGQSQMADYASGDAVETSVLSKLQGRDRHRWETIIAGLVTHRVLEKDMVFESGALEGGKVSNGLKSKVLQLIYSELEKLSPGCDLNIEKIARSVITHIENFANCKTIFEKFGRMAGASKEIQYHYNEVPFEIETEGCILSGKIDKLYYDEEKETWIIFDYKTGSLEGKSKQAIVEKEKYDWQLLAYAFAAREILGPATKLEKGLIFFTASKDDPLFEIDLRNLHRIEQVALLLQEIAAKAEKRREEFSLASDRSYCFSSCEYRLLGMCPR